jgi:hypothetical protein
MWNVENRKDYLFKIKIFASTLFLFPSSLILDLFFSLLHENHDEWYISLISKVVR